MSLRRGACALLVAMLAAGSPLAYANDEPEPYAPDEFPEWALDLRRAEIVAFGSLPLTLLASRLLYAIGRFAVVSIASGGLDPAYLPPAFAPPGSVPLSRSDNVRIVIAAALISSGVALADFLLGRNEPAGE